MLRGLLTSTAQTRNWLREQVAAPLDAVYDRIDEDLLGHLDLQDREASGRRSQGTR